MGKTTKKKKELLKLEFVSNPPTRNRLKVTKRRQRQEELLKEFFGHQVGDFYEEKQVEDRWYVKMYNGNSDKWQVAIFTNESFRNYKNFRG